MSVFHRAFIASLPAFFCYLPLGIVYAVLCNQQGFPWYYAPLFSTFVFAGAMQFLALSILAAGGSLLAVALGIVPLGIRNIFYGLTMLERYRSIPFFLRLYLAYGLVDTTYSLLNTGELQNEKDTRFITVITVFVHAYWVIGSLIGSFIIYFITMPKGLEFSLTAFFAAAAVEQFLIKKELKAVLIALSSIVFAWLLCPDHFFLGGISFSILICLLIPKRDLIKNNY